MTQYTIKIYDFNHLGNYPPNNIFVDGMGYFIINKIPMFFSLFKSTLKFNELAFLSAIMFAKKHFPVFCFSPFEYATIYIKSYETLSRRTLLRCIKIILSGNTKIPILFNPYDKFTDYNDAQKYIQKIRSKKIYIDMFDQKEMDIKQQTLFLSGKYNFSDQIINRNTFNRYYKLFSNISPFLTISLYHFIKAGRLINNYFVEDAGFNLNMSLEAIIQDFMKLSSIKNKTRAINELLLNKLQIKTELFDWFIELYDARNEFLAHIDVEKYDDEGFNSDPDAYCFDHYEPVANLLIKYIKFRQSITIKNV